MIKRAVIASLLSVGCDVMDLSSAPVPVARHFIRSSGAQGAINIRKLPGNSRITLIEMFDADGAYLSKAIERKVENVFFREDFRRTDPDDLGVIEFASRVIEDYQSDFYRELDRLTGGPSGKRLRMVCDFGYSALASILPPMLDRLNVEAVSLNTFNNAKLAPRSEEEVEHHVENVRHIVGTLGYDLGVLFTNEGERLTVVDGHGRLLSGFQLAGVLGLMLAPRHPGGSASLSVIAPQRLTTMLAERGIHVDPCKTDPPSIFQGAKGHLFAAGDEGGFVFPGLHAGFDGSFALAILVSLLGANGKTLAELVDSLPNFAVMHQTVPCEWDVKGSVMRHLAEAHPDADLTDGIKIADGDGWVLALPDSMEPWFHIYAEAGCPTTAGTRLAAFRRELETIIATGVV